MRLQQSGRSWVLHTPAKLNLFLQVLGKRDDGFHELETLMSTVSLFDTLVFTPAEFVNCKSSPLVSFPHDNPTLNSSSGNYSDDGTTNYQEHSTEELTNTSFTLNHNSKALSVDRVVSLRCHGVGSVRHRAVVAHDVSDGHDNLAVRAAELLLDQAGSCGSRGEVAAIQIDLYKRIPTAAGLAGGSSDAAAVLFALNQIWGIHLSRHELQEIASKIGSDVGFFFSPTPSAICRGRGEIVEPIRHRFRQHFVIVKPKTGLSTPLVFKKLAELGYVPEKMAQHRQAAVDDLVRSLHRGDLFSAGHQLRNSLQTPAEMLNEDINRIKAIFSRLSVVGHMMSGSGTSYFGLCRNKRHAQHVAGQLRANGEDEVFVVETPP